MDIYLEDVQWPNIGRDHILNSTPEVTARGYVSSVRKTRSRFGCITRKRGVCEAGM